MMIEPNFSLHEESSILTPSAAGVFDLLHCLRKGKSIVASQRSSSPISADPSEGQWLFCETSGTSGAPKKIRRRPVSWIRSFEHSKSVFGVASKDSYAVFGSLGHSLSLFAALEALHIGADLSVLSKQSPKRQIETLLRNGATVLYGTPTQLGLLSIAALNLSVSSLPSVRRIFIGGGNLSQNAKGGIASLFPNAQIREFFGASETSFITMSDASTPTGSVGRPYPGVALRIGDPLTCTYGDIGEIWVKSDYLFDGYAGDSVHIASWKDDYLSIGEMGYLGPEGSLFLKGRKDRMVTISDVNVFPEDIETVVGALPDVQHCAVIAAPDPKRGHSVICIVQASSSELNASEIRRLCRKELGQHSVPRAVYFLPEMPMLAAGKPDLVALQARYGDL